MKDMDRVHRLDVLWKVWKKNFLINNSNHTNILTNLDKAKETNAGSIRNKSLELIMEQMFAEIKFLKEENAFLREEGKEKTKLISILTANLLDNIEKQQTYLKELGVEFASLNYKKTSDKVSTGENYVPTTTTTTTTTTTSPPPTDRAKDDVKDDRKEEEEEIVCLFEDPFLKKEIIFLREETKEKSKLIAGLTNNLLQSTSKQDFQLHNHETKLSELTEELASLAQNRNLALRENEANPDSTLSNNHTSDHSPNISVPPDDTRGNASEESDCNLATEL